MRRCNIIVILTAAALILLPGFSRAESTFYNEVIVVAGAPGTAEYEADFTESVSLWRDACERGQARLTVIGTNPDSETSDCEVLQAALAAADRQGPIPLWIVLIGHGTFDGRSAKFNLRGKDFSAAELSKWLRPLQRPLAIINASSSSGPFINELSAPNRVIITAAKSGYEQNYAYFHRYFAAALGDPEADLDGDGQTSLLELFLYAAHGVVEFYKTEGRLATEHPLLDDNGDGLGTRSDWYRGVRPVKKARDDVELDGYRAHQFHLIPSDFDKRIPPDLRKQRDRLELEVINLRDGLTGPPNDAYLARLEELLLQIGKIYEQVEP